MIFGFYYFNDARPLDNDGDEKDKQDEYSVGKDNHDMKIATKGKEIVHHCKRNQKINHHTVGERQSLQLVT